MLFNSFDFFFFLPIVFILYWFVAYKSIKFQNIILLIASYVFYGWWDWRFLSLIALSTLIDYTAGLKIHESKDSSTKKKWLWLSIIFNLGMLGFFKYYNFFIDSWIDLCASLGYAIESSWTLQVILPVGISFYTFQTLSYSIDIYKGKLKPTSNFIAFATFVSFFPQLVAGPIERATNLIPQFLTTRKFTYKTFSYGIKLMIWGFFLKLVVADRAAIYVNAVYNNIDNHDGLSFIAATVLFAFQIYGDFAGYSLIAIGTSKLFGFDLMTNFKRPYFSTSVSEFWTRWHISLSTWFRDYLYIPLGGNRVKKPRWLFNLFITFLISGLWHGANWTFVVWGGLNGVYLILEVLFLKKKRKGILNIGITFILINFAWIFFRANTINDAFFIIKRICTVPGRLYIGSGDDITASLYATLAIAILVVIETKKEFFNTAFSISNNKYESVRLFGYAVLIYMILYFGVFGKSQFIYFQF
ncbi:MBOAT family protein [Aquimarina sp. AD10]|uniref:MBOAT family O-acyltransferase n=1 Tax=Aquimarina sp. AD10 TaxID=1714849 RepID=UPI000E4CB47A|nr:MBOAT family O-acyltransferase [Aquimarina sp. AD10]AXT59931.1 MBOAT family protein [Aquimarina sp. AD10]RKM95650.1 MBOAT family protein [Aquimarina sp. AD10]